MQPSPTPGLTVTRETSDATQAQLVLAGSLRRDDVSALLGAVEALWPGQGGRLRLDVTAVDDLDSAGAAVLLYIWRQAGERGVSLGVEGASDELKAQLSLFRASAAKMTLDVRKKGVLEDLGDTGVATAEGALTFAVLASDTTAEMLSSILKPMQVRWREFINQMAFIGSQALGTVGLITFLVGLTLAFQSAHQLQQFGADIYVADLTAVAMMREMGPLMTAILVAGRSGSAIAAEIATMKVSEELDALEVMGIPFTRFLAMPRIMATIVVMPLLVLMADALGILGGLTVGVLYMDLATGPYFSQTLNALGPKDLIMSLTKAVTFGWGIALIALFNGMKVRGGAQEVGTATTSSVVQSLFFIIVMDAIFSILFYVIL